MKNVLEQWGSHFTAAQLAAAELESLGDGVWRFELDNTTYVLKRRTNRTRVAEEYDLLKWLNESAQPVSLLLRTKEGVPWAEYQGLFYVLYPYVEGVPGDELNFFEVPYARVVGSTLASLHQALASYETSELFPGFDLFHEVSSYAWPSVQGYSAEKFQHRLHDLGHAIGEQLVNPYQTLPRQLIHRDFHPANLVFREEQLVGILDFDRVRIGIRLFDLCYLSTAVLSSNFADPKKRQSWGGFVQNLLAGYGSVQPLEKTEGHVFLYVVYLIQFLFAAHHLDAGNKDLADLNIAMLLWINDQHDYLESLIDKAVTN